MDNRRAYRAYYAIEHSVQRGWFMFDIERSEGKTEITWVRDLMVCLLWSSEESAAAFLTELDKIHLRTTIVDIRELQ